MTGQHAYCTDCGTKVKLEIAEDSDDWSHDDDGWRCPHCNPDSDKSW